MNLTIIPKFAGIALANYLPSRKGYQGIVIHWTAGSVDSTLAAFRNPARLASYNYLVSGKTIYGLVKDEHTAYHAGVFSVNQNFLGIAMEGGKPMTYEDGTPGNTVVLPETIDTAVELAAQKMVQLNMLPGAVSFDAVRRVNGVLQRVRVTSSRNIIGHREVKPTACPGNVNEEDFYNRVVARIAEIKGIGTPPAPEVPVAVPVVTETTIPVRTVRVLRSANFRAAPSTRAKINVTWDISPRQQRFVRITGTAQGESWQGSTLWLKTQGGNYIHSKLTNY